MGVRLGLLVMLAGVVLVVVGAVFLFGPVALVAAGALLIVAGLLVDFEEVTRHGKPPQPPA